MLKKFILSCLVFILLTFSFVPLVHAEEGGSWYNQGFMDWRAKVFGSPDSEIFGERYTHAQVQWIIYSLANFILTGGDPKVNEALNCIANNVVDLEACKDLLLSLTSQPAPLASKLDSGKKADWNNPLEFFASQPLSGVGYFINKAANLNLIPEVSAQESGGGFGFGSFGLILGLWKATRNIAFALVTIAVIIIAFMIMFRVKISPQVVISVQSALPKIVIGLILITFSYAIAGFLVDLMYVVIGLMAALIKGANLSTHNWTDLFKAFVESSAFWYIAKYFLIITIPLFIMLTVLGIAALLGATVTAGATGILLFIVLLLVIIGLVVFLWNAIKTIIMLIKTYVKIGLLVIISPLFALMGIVSPGFGFGNWLRLMISNLAVFPTVGVLFFLAFYFLAAGTSGLTSGGPFNPNVEGLGGSTWNPPLFNVGTGPLGISFLAVFMSFVIITLIPKTVEIIQSIIERKPFAYGTAIGEAVAAPGTIGILAAKYKEGIKSGAFNPPSPTVQKVLDKLSWLSFLKK